MAGTKSGAGAVVDHLAAARVELLAAGEVDWAGRTAIRYRAVLEAALVAVSGLRDAAEETHRASVRHQAAVDAARAGVGT